jgi:hypothetical protein
LVCVTYRHTVERVAGGVSKGTKLNKRKKIFTLSICLSYDGPCRSATIIISAVIIHNSKPQNLPLPRNDFTLSSFPIELIDCGHASAAGLGSACDRWSPPHSAFSPVLGWRPPSRDRNRQVQPADLAKCRAVHFGHPTM